MSTPLGATSASAPKPGDAKIINTEPLTRPKTSDIDGVGILAILQPPEGGEPVLLLQKQFRPPIGKVTIEIPAGLVDEGESAAEAAVRELNEETGYVGVVREEDDGEGEGVVMFNDPGFCNTNLRMVTVDVNLSLPANRSPKPSLEENEFIEVFTVPLRELYAECKKLEKGGFAIDARVGTLAEGLEVARKVGLRWN